ncbi:MAG: RelA/SpoT family protein [Deltaproteobacteria bacterium]|nr:RelA/SpoT family protein [Deltaproteobacteria bacterium]
MKAYVTAAMAHKDMTRHSGEPYLTHPLSVAATLAEMRLDHFAVAAGLLHDTVEDTKMTLEEIREEFGEEVAKIVDGMTKAGKVNFSTTIERRAFNMQKILIYMFQDLRVLYVKLADRLHNMRTLGYMSNQKQIAISRETLDFFAPLAGRVGSHKIMAELQDLALFYLHPTEYANIRQLLSSYQKDRTQYIADMKKLLSDKMKESKISCEIEGRSKHVYSIYRKMVDQNLPFDQIFDLVAFRIIVENVQDCYQALGVIHTVFRPIPGRFKDYINVPKPNGYQSLHTVVIGLLNFRAEIQIRTREMHACAEEGVAAHWSYKEGGKTPTTETELTSYLRKLTDWQKTENDGSPQEDADSFMTNFRAAMAEDQFIFVMTPEGEVIDLPVGSTVVDFAYAVHSALGDKCCGGVVNDVKADMRQELNNGDIVFVITSATETVSADWLDFVKSFRAKEKIKQRLARLKREKEMVLGEDLIRTTMTKLKLSRRRLDSQVLESLGCKNLDDLNLAVGQGRAKIAAVIEAIKPGLTPPAELTPSPAQTSVSAKKLPAILVDGLENVAVSLAKCCSPLHGEPVVGILTQGKGVSVHSAICPSVSGLSHERLVSATWTESRNEEMSGEAFIKLVLADQKRLAAVIGVFVACGSEIGEFHHSEDYPSQIWFRISVNDYGQCQAILEALSAMENEVLQAERFIPPFTPFSSF